MHEDRIIEWNNSIRIGEGEKKLVRETKDLYLPRLFELVWSATWCMGAMQKSDMIFFPLFFASKSEVVVTHRK